MAQLLSYYLFIALAMRNLGKVGQLSGQSKPSILFILRCIPEHIRSDNGFEFTARVVRKWLGRLGGESAFIEPGSPWENGYIKSFNNNNMRDELLDREIFTTLKEAKVLIEQWRQEYNQVCTHS